MKRTHQYESLYAQYTHGKQTLAQLAVRHGVSERTIRRRLDTCQPATGIRHIPDHPVVVIMDATFWSRKDGILIARAEGRNLLWRDITSETIREYEVLLTDMEAAGCQFAGFVIDGRKGVKDLLLKRFPHLSLQLCQFHQLTVVKRYLTRTPKLEAGRQLLRIAKDITHCGAARFRRKLRKWLHRFDAFLAERTPDSSHCGWHYTHKRLRSAYRSLMTNLPWLFTYLSHAKLSMPNTTNSCDGSFAHLKEKVKLHRGLRAHRRKKMADYFLQKGCS